MRSEYTEKMLYTQVTPPPRPLLHVQASYSESLPQLKYYESKLELEPKHASAQKIPEQHKNILGLLHQQISEEIKCSSYNWIPAGFFDAAFQVV